MRILALMTAGIFLLAAPACSADEPEAAFELPESMAGFPGDAPALDDLLDGVQLSPQQCQLLQAATVPIPFEATTGAVADMAETYLELGLAVPELAPATGVAAAGLDAAAQAGADRQAMLAIWFDTGATAALRALASFATNHCGAGFRWIALGPADRAVELAEQDHPDSPVLPDIVSWAMSITGQPETIYWSFGYTGDEPVQLCEQMAETLASIGFGGTALTVHDVDLVDVASGQVGGSCRPV